MTKGRRRLLQESPGYFFDNPDYLRQETGFFFCVISLFSFLSIMGCEYEQEMTPVELR
jgi:hypothetical protein